MRTPEYDWWSSQRRINVPVPDNVQRIRAARAAAKAGARDVVRFVLQGVDVAALLPHDRARQHWTWVMSSERFNCGMVAQILLDALGRCPKS